MTTLNNQTKLYLLVGSAAIGLVFLLWLANFFFNFGSLSMTVVPSEARVTTGGKEYGASEKISLRPGKHDVTISLPGYQSLKISGVVIDRGVNTKLKKFLISNKVYELVKRTPYDDGDFTIEFENSDKGPTFTVGLTVIDNYDWQSDQYIENLKIQKAKFVSFLKTMNLKESDIMIDWLQPEAAKL